MSLATLAQNQAAMAIRRYGATATLTQITQGAFDPATGTSGSTTVSTATKAILDASSLQGLGYTFGQDQVIDGDLKATIPAKGLDVAPKPGDGLTIGATTYTIKAVRPLYVGASAVTYELLVRA